MKTSPSPSAEWSGPPGFLIVLVCLLVALGGLFFRSFDPNLVIFSNDGPLGAISSNFGHLPDAFTGVWQDLNWIGGEGISASPSLTMAVDMLIKPLGYAKFMAPLALLFLGLSAWLFFRQLNLTPIACIIGGLAVALNSDFLSTACWGVVAQPVCFSAGYLALAALANPSARHSWIRVILAGFAVGLGIMEGFDLGAIFSLFVAAFVLFQSWNAENDSPAPLKLGKGVLQLALVAGCAAFISAQALSSLVGTQVKGVVQAKQEDRSTKERWDYATQWSLPKAEVLQLAIPGIFGYRMDTPDGGAYWGSVGETPGIEELKAARSDSNEQVRSQADAILKSGNISWRFSGGGSYAGVLVVVVALWTVLQSFRKSGSPFSLAQRRFVWFWTAMAFIALLLAFGRYAPFFQFFYALPYASTIRNPAKFIHVVTWALLIIFACGLDGLVRAYMTEPLAEADGILARFKSWWSKAPGFDKKWLIGCGIALGLSVAGWLMYANSASKLEAYLGSSGFDPKAPEQISAIARHSVGSVAWFILFFMVTVGLLTLILSGQF